MDSAQLYRNRAAHLRELASHESDVSVRQQLLRAAIGFDDFADELEARAAQRADTDQRA
jgi:hypothetical protein